jgi:hypothetical protein
MLSKQIFERQSKEDNVLEHTQKLHNSYNITKMSEIGTLGSTFGGDKRDMPRLSRKGTNTDTDTYCNVAMTADDKELTRVE